MDEKRFWPFRKSQVQKVIYQDTQTVIAASRNLSAPAQRNLSTLAPRKYPSSQSKDSNSEI